jgi:pimeloyl-ACP methyl ester carboxylesterase
MRIFRRTMLAALAAGVLAFLVVPLVVPFNSSGTLTNTEAAGMTGEFVSVGEFDIFVRKSAYSDEMNKAQGDESVDSSNHPVIFLLHGFGASTFSWRDVMASLSVAGDVVAYDRPAFGFSDRPSKWAGINPYGLQGNMEILKALMKIYAEDREVVLVGHSAGGLLAGEFARQNPQLVDKLVLVAPAVFSTGETAWLSYFKNIPQIDALGPFLVQGIASSGNELLVESYYNKDQLTDFVSEGYRAPLKISGWERAFWEYTNAPRANDFLKNISSLIQPTLLITGEFDTVVPTKDTKKLAGLINNNDLVVIEKTAHLPQEENPEAFSKAVIDWLRASNS